MSPTTAPPATAPSIARAAVPAVPVPAVPVPAVPVPAVPVPAVPVPAVPVPAVRHRGPSPTPRPPSAAVLDAARRAGLIFRDELVAATELSHAT
ncbi:MAG: hypothetical protein QOD04_41, partial [Pseudonocardiales bacterium]|nr:hypothetical protein [Pseudonocardiales bacterium]